MMMPVGRELSTQECPLLWADNYILPGVDISLPARRAATVHRPAVHLRDLNLLATLQLPAVK
jgi:hypothetical protein